ncbi:hypothetical protein PAHAL_4G006300 [Panicum hallii]|jgi:hypothetical protein|uniref:Glycosyltransferase family 92 protein n=1 Tax=Panicum hallii TaxID=206008 RepID=A0A2S3HG62_9POAL|nr:glycosyltransferase family 92 protein Os08g0121900 [Panicum hallii]PAN22248.1 hypothetical protein PAHAL_4G006300 [Panicum hallii]
MQSPPSPRLLLLLALALAALLAFLTSTPTAALHHYAASSSSPARALLVPQQPRTQHRLTLRAVREDASSATPANDDDRYPLQDAVLLPDWEVLVLLHPAAPESSSNATCAFPGGAASPARSLGRMPASGRQAYTCAMPRPERRRNKPFRAPRLVTTTTAPSSQSQSQQSRWPRPEMLLRWSGRLAYDAVALPGTGDVLVLAKGVNPRQGVNRPASDVQCVYYRHNATGDGVVASLPAATSAQQVFRCPAPPATAGDLRVTLAVAGGEPIPSMATYSPPTAASGGGSSSAHNKNSKKVVMCACTMVRDVAKFLREWVVYHAAVGVDRFLIYDNGSQDDLEGEVRQLSAAGFDVSTHVWPWPKTQEAGFSYAAAAHRDSCEWMAFVDVDEFIFSPRWAESSRPSKSSMLRSVVAAVEPDVGQVSLGCKDFGPSGQTKHPEEGVTQGYACRRRAEERHKSVVRLDALEPSLMNSIHHFEVRPEFRWERSRQARVNHYKYQAWDEFKVKFRRRVSTYVADWTDPVNHGSKDRTPGLGFEAVEPEGWAHRFCEVEDTLLRDATRRWFGVGFTSRPS